MVQNNNKVGYNCHSIDFSKCSEYVNTFTAEKLLRKYTFSFFKQPSFFKSKIFKIRKFQSYFF